MHAKYEKLKPEVFALYSFLQTLHSFSSDTGKGRCAYDDVK